MIHMEIFFSFLIGLVIGSFINVVVYRLPQGESIVMPRSYCTYCKSPLRFWQLIPLVSYLILGGRCGQCTHPFSPRYFLVELANGSLFALLTTFYGVGLYTLFHSILIAILIAISIIDWEHLIIPDSLNITIIFLGLLGIFLGITVTWSHAVLGAFLGGGILLLLALFFPDGMGGGDIKLIFALGLITGWQWILLLLFLASLIGTAFGAINILIKGREKGRLIPFGPFLALGALMTIHFGEQLISLYIQLFL